MCVEGALNLILRMIDRWGFKPIVRRGRFIEEHDVEVLNIDEHVMGIALFTGRKPYYPCWVELFNINPYLRLDGNVVKTAGSRFEEDVLTTASQILNGGEIIYVEYLYDDETKTQLMRGYPPAVTRLGYILLNRGFTWFKDWYYPEGGLEGGPKLEGVKPINAEEESRQLSRIIQEAGDFLKRTRCIDEYCEKALERAERIINMHKDNTQ